MIFNNNDYISRLVCQIEEDLPSKLDTGLLSLAGAVSHAKLYRDFYNSVGHSVKEYIRKRRLSNALALIKSSDVSLTDIALRCGYSSHQALCRAVKDMLGVTPSAYKSGGDYYFFPPWGGEPLQAVTVSNETIPPTLRILFYDTSFAHIETAALHTFLADFPDYGGRIFGRNGQQERGRFCYELYLTDTALDCGALAQSGFQVMQQMPAFAATFATSTVKNDALQINAAWDYLYAIWLQSSMFAYTDEPYYEEYMLRNGAPVKLKLYLPIRKRREETKISVTNNPQLRFLAAKAEGSHAETAASRLVAEYVTAYYPHLVKSFKELLLQKGGDFCVCGVRVPWELQPVETQHIISVMTEKSRYLVLESSVTGDYDRYAALLLSFARENGMQADKQGIFAVYDARVSFDNPDIKLYCPVKIDTN